MTVDLVATSIRVLSPDERPLPAQAGDANDWVVGHCWLYCMRDGVPVVWIGAVTAPGGVTAPMTACGECVSQLATQTFQFAAQRDAPVRTRGRHARSRPRRPFWRLPPTDRERPSP